MKKIICLLISIIMCFSLITAVGAESNSSTINASTKNAIINELSYYSNNKSFIGLENVKFENLKIGEEIVVYEYLSSGFNTIASAHLLIEGNDIVTLAYKIDDSHYQFMTSLSQLIAAANEDIFAIVYDKFGCYLYNGNSFIEICYNNEFIVETRDIISNATQIQKEQIQLRNTVRSVPLQYTNNIRNTRDQSNYFCSVNYVTQNPYDKICWAATIAMIANTINGTSLTAVNVASNYYGSNFNEYVTISIAQSILNNTYNLQYTYKNRVPSDNEIALNIQYGFPIFSRFMQSNTANGHSVVLYGINIIAGRIMIIDPTFGSTSCYLNSNGDYYYVYSGSGSTMIFTSAICRVW